MNGVEPVKLDGRSLSAEQVECIAYGGTIAIDPRCEVAMKAGRAIVERYLREGIPAYGLNTGLGSRVTQTLSSEELTQFAYRTVRGRAQGWGPPLELSEVRAVMAARLNTLLSGEAGASEGIAPALAQALIRNAVPVMPRWASIGAGDLVAMAALPHALIGEGEMLIEGKRVAAREGLARAKMEPLVLKPKDGTLLCNITSFSVGLAALATAKAKRSARMLQIAGALTLEGFRGNISPFSSGATRVRPQPGEVKAGDEILRLLEGGLLLEEGAARRLQDPLSLRCMAQVHGAAYAQLDALDECLTVELNHAADNPVVLIEEGRIVSTGNFHLPLLAQRLDGATRALAWAANDSVSRVARLMNAQLSGLPPLLSSEAASRAGLSPVLKPAEAVRADIIHLATPVPILPSHTADGQEDSATFSALAAQKLSDLLVRLDCLVAFEMLAAAQAIDLARPTRIAPRLARVHDAIRGISRFIDDDRPLGGEVERIVEEVVKPGRALDLAD